MPLLSLVLVLAPIAQDAAPVKIERRDIAPAFLRLDRTFARHRAELTPEALAAANEEMDAASLDFFGLRFASAIRRLERARWTCLPDAPDREVLEALASLRIEVEPVARVTALFAVPAFADRSLETTLRRWNTEGRLDSDLTLEFDAGGRVVSKELPPVTFSEASCTFTAVVGPGGGYYAQVRHPFAAADDLRARLLAEVRDVPEGLEGALRVYRARVALIHRLPVVAGGSIELLIDLLDLTHGLRADSARLRAGENPYALRSGGLWRVIPHGKSDLPLRVSAPDGLSRDEPLPLVIALHGAGGDENFFHEAGGVGRLVELAREHRFLLAAPRTTDYALNPKAFDSLLAGLAADYPVDRERIYFIGHSLGAMTAANLLKVRRGRIARAVCISGAREFTTDTPVLVLSGRLDRVVPAAGLERQVAQARELGLPVEIEVFEHQGHTLFVPAALERAVQWLGLEQR